MNVSCPSLWLPALRGREEERESMHDGLKIASVGSAIFSRSGIWGCMWLLELA